MRKITPTDVVENLMPLPNEENKTCLENLIKSLEMSNFIYEEIIVKKAEEDEVEKKGR